MTPPSLKLFPANGIEASTPPNPRRESTPTPQEAHPPANKTLSDNLDRMQEQGIINREVENEKPVKITYEFTDFGERLVPLIEDMISWGRENLRKCEKEEAWVK
jgi:DNA-binding HxlR family transcriptional regulator